MSRLLLALALLAGSSLALGAQSLQLRSDLPAYEASVLGQLPSAPADRLQECRSASPTQTAGKAVAAAGWQVISESVLNGYGLVSFAASSSPGAEGLCDFKDGNLAVFSGDTLLGLFWGRGEASQYFGALAPAGEGVVRMSSALFPVVPVAEIRQQGETLILSALPATLSDCEGRVEVPQAWLAPIGQMRSALTMHGWAPTTPKAADPIAAEMQAQGFPETESCSGTGYNYCSFEYANDDDLLRVITIGELSQDHQPVVTDYEVTCGGGKP